MINREGDTGFSFVHNLLKSWLYGATNVLMPLLHDFQPLQGARLLTIIFSGLTAFFVSLSVRSITGSAMAAMITTMLWFTIPGNLYLISPLKDTTWGNAFNAAFLFLVLKLSGYSLPRTNGSVKLIMLSIITGAVLSAGVNIHQQVVVNFYSFFILMVFSFERRWSLALCMSAAFVTAYIGGTLAQNYVAFGHPELYPSIQRLYHDPYKSIFPDLYFFTSGQALDEWSSRIILGWKRIFLFDERHMPFWAPFCLIAIIGMFRTVAECRRRGTFVFLYQGRILAFLAVATLVHVPHSLVYEPENVKRWGSALPGLMILTIVCAHAAMKNLTQYRKAKTTIIVALVGVTLISLCQTWHYFSKSISEYHREPAVLGLNQVIGYLANQPETSERHVVLLDSLYDYNDIQARVTYHFPRVTVVTLDHNLSVLYSSMELQNRRPLGGSRIPKIVFPTNSYFSVTTVVFDDLKTKAPEFISSNTIHVISAGSHETGDMD